MAESATKALFDTRKLEVSLDTTPISEIQKRLSMAEMQVKEKEMRVQDLQDMILVTEQEKDGKIGNIEKLETRLQDVLTILKERQEELHGLHLTKSLARDENDGVSDQVREQLESLMNGDTDSKAKRASAFKDARNDESFHLESVEVRCREKLIDRMNFRVIDNLDFHTLLVNAARYFQLVDPGTSETEISSLYRLVGAKGQNWDLTERVVDQLKMAGDEWEIEIEEVIQQEQGPEEESDFEEEEKEEDEDEDGHIVLHYPPRISRALVFRELVMFIVFATLFMVILYSGRNIQHHQFLYQAHREALIEEEFGSESHLTYHDISNFAEFWDWTEGPLSEGLFPASGEDDPVSTVIGAPATELLNYNKLTGGVRFNQNRVNKVTFEDCKIANKRVFKRINNVTKEESNLFEFCFPMYNHNKPGKDPYGPADGETVVRVVNSNGTVDLRSTQNCLLEGIDVEGFCFQKANHSWGVSGNYGTYDNSGFIFDVDSISPDGQEFMDAVAFLKENEWLDRQTRSVQIDFISYNANLDLYTSVLFIIEFTASGFVNPHFVIETFSMTIWEGWQRNHPTVASILELVVFLYIMHYAYQEFKELKMAKKITGSYKEYFKQIWNVVDDFIIIVYLSTVGCRLWFFFTPRRWGFSPFRAGYTEFYDVARLYNTGFELDAGVVMLLSFKLFKYFQLSKNMALLWKTLTTAGGSIVYFMFMFGIILVGFALMGQSLFGTNLLEYSTFGRTFETLLLMILGEFDYERLRVVDEIWAPFFFCLYMVFVFFVLLNIFLAILNEAYGAEAAKLQEDAMLGGAEDKKGLRRFVQKVRRDLRERKKAKAAEKAEVAKFNREMQEERRQEKDKEKPSKLRALQLFKKNK